MGSERFHIPNWPVHVLQRLPQCLPIGLGAVKSWLDPLDPAQSGGYRCLIDVLVASGRSDDAGRQIGPFHRIGGGVKGIKHPKETIPLVADSPAIGVGYPAQGATKRAGPSQRGPIRSRPDLDL